MERKNHVLSEQSKPEKNTIYNETKANKKDRQDIKDGTNIIYNEMREDSNKSDKGEGSNREMARGGEDDTIYNKIIMAMGEGQSCTEMLNTICNDLAEDQDCQTLDEYLDGKNEHKKSQYPVSKLPRIEIPQGPVAFSKQDGVQ